MSSIIALLHPKLGTSAREVHRLREQRAADIDHARQAFKQAPPAHHLQLLDQTADDVREAILRREVTCTDMAKASIFRCATRGFALGAITQPTFSRALERAAELDALLSSSSASINELRDAYPFLGVPFSVKEEYEEKGTVQTAGVAFKAAGVAAQDSILVHSLVQRGGIPVVRSNLPQLVMASETDNYVWGRCDNPLDPTRTCGGSSGGEGALIGSRCTIFGLGSDIAGSVRIPSFDCGIMAFKPTAARLTTLGFTAVSRTGYEGQNLVKVVAGPMARATSDLVKVMRAWWAPSSEMWKEDPNIPRMPFDESIFQDSAPGAGPGRALKFGYYLHDGLFEAAPSCKRAVLEAAEALRQAGHDVVFWDPHEHGINMRAAGLAYGALIGKDAITEMVQTLGNERLHSVYTVLAIMAALPFWLRWVLCFVLNLFGYRRMADIVYTTRERTMLDSWNWNRERQARRHPLIQQLKADNIDLLLSPGMGVPAWLHGQGNFLEMSTMYCWVWNYLDFPAGAMTVTQTREDECWYSDTDSDLLTNAAMKCMENAAGMPTGVHISAPSYQDELVLLGMQTLEQALQGRQIPLQTALETQLSRAPPFSSGQTSM